MPSKSKSTSKQKQASTKQIQNENVNINERRDVEAQLHQPDERFSKAFHASPTALTLSRLSDSKFEYVNESFLQLSEYQREDVIGKSVVELNLFPDLAQIARVRQLLIESKQVRNIETTIRTKNGNIKQVLFSVDIILSDQHPYSLTTIMDVTDRIRAEKQVVQMKRLYATLSQVNQTIVRVKTSEELYQSICDVALKFGELTVAWIGLLDEATGDIRPVATSGMSLDITQWPFPIINIHATSSLNGVITEAMHTSNTITSEDVQTDVRTIALHNVVEKFGFHSLAAVPFRLQGKTIGVLVMISTESGIFKAEEELRLFDEMGLDISFALDTMEVEKERRQAEEKVEQQNRRLKILHEIDLAILAADSVENIVGAALSHIRELIDCRRANLTLIDRETNELVIFEARTAGDTSIPAGSRLPVAMFEDIIQTLSQNQPILFSDYRTVVDPMPGIQRLLRDGILSTCSLPLFSQGSLFGMLSLHSEIPGFFDEEKIALGREVANQVAIAITQSRLLDELHESEEKYRAFFQNSMDAILLTSTDGSIQAANPAACRMFGHTEAEICAVTRSELVDTNDTRLKSLLEERTQTGQAFGELTMFRKDGTPFAAEMSSALFRDLQGNIRTNMIIRDITERKNAEKQIIQMKRLYATLSQVNQTIVRVQSREELYQSICDVALKFGELNFAWIGLLNETTGDVQPVAWSGMDVDIAHWPIPITNIHQNPPRNGVITEALHTSNTITSEDVQTDERTDALHSTLQKYGFRSLAAVPFRLRGKTIGVLVMISVERGMFEAEAERKLLDEMGLDISFALDTMANRAEQARAEALSHENEQKFSTLFMKAPYAIQLSKLPDGSIVEVNDEWENLVGYSRQEAVGRTSTELNMYPDPQIRERLKAEFDARGYARNVEMMLRQKSGDLCSILTNTDILEIAGTRYLLTTAQDITERRRSEKKLRYQAHLLENVNDAIVASDENYIITAWNAAAESTYGWKAEEVIGKRGVDLLRTQFVGAAADEMRSQIARSGRFFGEATQLRKDGTRIAVELASIVLKDESGKITGYVSVNRDITERKRAENSIRLAAQQYRLLFEESPVMVVLTEYNGTDVFIAKCNQEFLSTLGYEQDEVIGKSLTGFYSADSRTKLEQSYLQTITGIPLSEERELITRDGRIVPVLMKAVPRANAEGTVIGTQASYIDITERKRAEDKLRTLNAELEQRVAKRTEELNKANIELEHANRAKDEFLASMSHELRTPLNSILGLSETLLEQRRGPLNQNQQNSLQLIEASGQHLLALINDILDVSKIEAGKLEFVPDTVSVDELCVSSLTFIKAQALKKSITVAYVNEAAVPYITADSKRLKQILVNLLTNAIKFTPERGNVTLKVTTLLEQNVIQFSVIDTGIGISSDDLGKLFQPFVQLDSSLNRQHQGTGLGLALVQKLTELHGGSVYVESEVGKGSRFTINLRCAEEDLAKPGVADLEVKSSTDGDAATFASTQLSGRAGVVLLAEDTPSNILTIGDYLESFNYEVVVVNNGVDALKQVEQVQPDIILMDIQMPVMDGLEAIAQLRKNARYTSTPIIALTALAMPGDKERCLAAGATEYMSKPVRLRNLLNLMQKLMKPGR